MAVAEGVRQTEPGPSLRPGVRPSLLLARVRTMREASCPSWRGYKEGRDHNVDGILGLILILAKRPFVIYLSIGFGLGFSNCRFERLATSGVRVDLALFFYFLICGFTGIACFHAIFGMRR